MALTVSRHDYTFAELNAEVNQLANALLAAGITKGDKVSTVMTNRLELVLMYWAAAKTGIVIVPVSTLLQDGGLRGLLTDSESIMVIADASFADTLKRIRGDLPAIHASRFILAGERSSVSRFYCLRRFHPPSTDRGAARRCAGR